MVCSRWHFHRVTEAEKKQPELQAAFYEGGERKTIRNWPCSVFRFYIISRLDAKPQAVL